MLRVNGNQITLTKGDTCNFAVEVKDSQGNLYNLSEKDGTLLFTLCKEIGDEEKVIQKPFEGNVLSLSSADTFLNLGVYVYDVVLQLPDNSKYTIIPPTPFKIVGEVHN